MLSGAPVSHLLSRPSPSLPGRCRQVGSPEEPLGTVLALQGIKLSLSQLTFFLSKSKGEGRQEVQEMSASCSRDVLAAVPCAERFGCLVSSSPLSSRPPPPKRLLRLRFHANRVSILQLSHHRRVDVPLCDVQRRKN